MAGKKDSARFIFFKYVPPRKDEKQTKVEEYNQTALIKETGLPEIPAEPEAPIVPEIPGGLGTLAEPEISTEPEISEGSEEPKEPELPELPELPECPEEPEVPAGPCPENAVRHVIQAGDTFWKLAKKYGITVEAITAANPDADPLNLQPGETVCIPLGVPGAKG